MTKVASSHTVECKGMNHEGREFLTNLEKVVVMVYSNGRTDVVCPRYNDGLCVVSEWLGPDNGFCRYQHD